ncbi:MAG: hypothetical protein KC713_07835 [Candidatus Omnitrophica bacterium]|nr:hypothetical protein [Candidatus Omnitrophota bacterium]
MSKIPKIIHYCRFGKQRKSVLFVKCQKSWRIHLEGYQLKEWNETNIPHDEPYVKKALQEKQYSRLSNFIRLYALQQEGGIYLDTDIEVIRPFDELHDLECFLGFQLEEKQSHWLNNCVIGARKGHAFITRNLEHLVRSCMTDNVLHPQPQLTTETLLEMGLKEYGTQTIGGVTLLPKEYFFPYFMNEKFHPDQITDKTYCIHHWEASWVDPADLHRNYGISKKFLMKVIGMFFMLALTGYVTRRLLWNNPLESVLQSVLLSGLALIIFSNKAFHYFYRYLPKNFQIFSTVFFSLLILFHLVDIPRTTFPFVSWQMFGRTIKKRQVDAYKFYGHLADGNQKELYLPHILPTLQNGRLTGALKSRIGAIVAYRDNRQGNEPAEEILPKSDSALKEAIYKIRPFFNEHVFAYHPNAEDQLKTYVTALGSIYNLKHPDEPLSKLSVDVCRIDIDQAYPNNTSCQTRWIYSIEEEGSP